MDKLLTISDFQYFFGWAKSRGAGIVLRNQQLASGRPAVVSRPTGHCLKKPAAGTGPPLVLAAQAPGVVSKNRKCREKS